MRRKVISRSSRRVSVRIKRGWTKLQCALEYISECYAFMDMEEGRKGMAPTKELVSYMADSLGVDEADFSKREVDIMTDAYMDRRKTY